MMKKVIFLAVVSLAAAGCASTSGTTNSTAPAATDAEFNKLVSQAENEIKLANQAGFLWTKTEGFLTAAKEAKAKGDMNAAMKNVNIAIKEAQLAQQQAKDQANAKAPF